MNDKDKKAYEKYFVENNVNQRQIWNILSLDEIWQAACEYKDKNNITFSDYDLLFNDYKKLQAENAKLKKCVKFYADYRNHGFPGDAEISDYEKDKLSFFKQGKRARQVLKELDSNQLGEGKNE